MKFVPYDREDIKNLGGYKQCKNQKILEEFANSEYDCVEIVDYTNKNSNYCAASLNVSIKRFKFSNMNAISRDGRVFLIKTT